MENSCKMYKEKKLCVIQNEVDKKDKNTRYKKKFKKTLGRARAI